MLLPVLPAVALAMGCGSLDSSKGEQAIKTNIEQATGAKAVEVDCPDDVDQKKDENFDCTATVDGQGVNVPVEQTDDDGKIEFAPEIIKTRQIQQQLEQQANQRTESTSGAKAQCPVVVPLEKGSSFECDVQTPGPDFKGKVTQVSDDGRVTAKLEPASGS